MRTVIRALLVLVLVAVVGVILLNFWPAGWSLQRARTDSPSSSVGTTGTSNTERARERAGEIGEKAALATRRIEENLAEAGTTTKIKAKMALDDTLKARAIDVSTEGSTVTVSGSVPSVAAHNRAIALARETAGVSVVVDHLDVVSAR
jgi:hyperosmotically inducible protein